MHWKLAAVTVHTFTISLVFNSQVKEAMQRIHDRGNIGKLILDVEKTPTPLVCQFYSLCLFPTNDEIK